MSTLEETFVIDGNTVTVRAPEGKKGALPVVYLNVFQGDGAEVWERLGELGCAPLALADAQMKGLGHADGGLGHADAVRPCAHAPVLDGVAHPGDAGRAL